MRSDATHSITMLKQKFDEIKRNINTIEQKQKEFFSQGLPETKTIYTERSQRPSSVNRFSDAKPKDPDRTEQLLRVIKDLEGERLLLYRKIEDYKKENESLKDSSTTQEKKIKLLQFENQQLKIKLEKAENIEKRPQSCLRDSKTPPKKNRVAFSKDLVSFFHIDEIQSAKISPRGSKVAEYYSSPVQTKPNYNQNLLVSPPDRLYSISSGRNSVFSS